MLVISNSEILLTMIRGDFLKWTLRRRKAFRIHYTFGWCFNRLLFLSRVVNSWGFTFNRSLNRLLLLQILSWVLRSGNGLCHLSIQSDRLFNCISKFRNCWDLVTLWFTGNNNLFNFLVLKNWRLGLNLGSWLFLVWQIEFFSFCCILLLKSFAGSFLRL